MKYKFYVLIVIYLLFCVSIAKAGENKEEFKQYVSPYLSAGVGFYLEITSKTYVGHRRVFEGDIFYLAKRRNEFLTIIWNHKPYKDSRAPKDFQKLNTQVNNMEMTCRIWEHHIELQKVTYFSKECDLNLGIGKYGERYGNQYLHFFYYDLNAESKELAEKVISSARRIQNY